MMRPPPAAFIARERKAALARSQRAVASDRRTYRAERVRDALLDVQAFLVIVAAIVMVCGSTLAFIDWIAL